MIIFIYTITRFDDAITSYHRALALNPGSAFCTEMLTRALEDSCLFADSTANTDDPEIQEDSETMQDDSFIDPLNDSSLALSS